MWYNFLGRSSQEKNCFKFVAKHSVSSIFYRDIFHLWLIEANSITCERLTSSICGDLEFSPPYCNRLFYSLLEARYCRIFPWFLLILIFVFTLHYFNITDKQYHSVLTWNSKYLKFSLLQIEKYLPPISNGGKWNLVNRGLWISYRSKMKKSWMNLGAWDTLEWLWDIFVIRG